MMTIEQIAALLAERVVPGEIPDMVKPVCIVTGDNYQMGFQYGQQLQKNICTRTLHLAARLILERPNVDIIADAYRYEEILRSQSPELIEMFKGTAEGADLPYEAILVYTILNLAQVSPNQCSTISAWGSSTLEGHLIAGCNADGAAFTHTSYEPTMVMYPKEGNVSVNNGGYNSNFAMNNKGLVNLASNGGWNGRRDDRGIGTPSVLPAMYLNWRCSTAKEAVERYTLHSAPISAAENMHCADISGETFLIEATHSHYYVRRPGEHGEKDYLLATNYFLSEEMQSSKPATNNSYINAQFRYRTEDKLLKENHGKITLETIDGILSCRDYYDGEKWVKDVWDEEYSKWTPEKRSHRNATYMQCLADPERRTAYIRQGQSCVTSSCMPGSTGKFSRLILKDTPLAMVMDAEEEAKRQVFSLSERLETGRQTLDWAVERRMNEAKRCVWEGSTHMSRALAFGNDINRYMLNLGKAATSFSKAQVLANI